MELNGDLQCKRSMASALRATSGVSGFHDIVRRHFNITEQRVPMFDPTLRADIKKASLDYGFPLTDLQTLAISKIVHMDSSSISIQASTLATPLGSSYVSFQTSTSVANYSKKMDFATPSNDICRPSILDLPTGSGKTMISCMSSLLFAIDRNEEMKIVPSYICAESSSGLCNVPFQERESNRKCVVFVPKHLVKHWVNESKKAIGMINIMRPQWDVTVYVNKISDSVHVEGNEIALIICDPSYGPKKVIKSGDFFPSVCFEESGQRNCKSLNQNFQGLRCGRFMMVSADLKDWKNKKPIVTSVLREKFPSWTNDLAYSCISYLSPPELSNYLTTAASLAVACVFSESERSRVMRESSAPLESIDMYTASVKYVPSILERLDHGSAIDLGQEKGADIFEKTYGIDIAGCKTLGDVIREIEGRIRVLAERKIGNGFCLTTDKLQKVVRRLSDILREDCPICLEEMKEACLLQPCLHFTCSSCVHRIGRSCPMCRCHLQGSVSLEQNLSLKRPAPIIEESVQDKRFDGGGSSDVAPTEIVDDDLGHLFFRELESTLGSRYPIPGGVFPAITSCLSAIKSSHLKRGGGTLTIMLICPGDCSRKTEIESMGFKFYPYRTMGSRADPVYRKAMDKVIDTFIRDDGNMKILAVQDNDHRFTSPGTQGIDNMTGLDLPSLNVVLTVGRGSVSQRLGRLCRLSRKDVAAKDRSALYVELVPSMI